MFLSHLIPENKRAIVHMANKEPQLGNRDLFLQTGGMLGGGSSVNFLMYTRGAHS